MLFSVCFIPSSEPSWENEQTIEMPGISEVKAYFLCLCTTLVARHFGRLYGVRNRPDTVCALERNEQIMHCSSLPIQEHSSLLPTKFLHSIVCLGHFVYFVCSHEREACEWSDKRWINKLIISILHNLHADTFFLMRCKIIVPNIREHIGIKLCFICFNSCAIIIGRQYGCSISYHTHNSETLKWPFAATTTTIMYNCCCWIRTRYYRRVPSEVCLCLL